MSTVLMYLQALFDDPACIIAIVYFVFKLIVWLCTLNKRKTEKMDNDTLKAEIADIYLATAQVYQAIKENEHETKKL